MKVSEIDRNAYECRSVSVITPHCTSNFPNGNWETVLRMYGACDVAEDGISVTENGYLLITVQNMPA